MLYTNIQYVYSLLSHYNKRHRDKLWASLCLGQLWHIRTWLSRASGGLVWYQFGLEWGSGKFLGRISGLGHFACLAPCMAGCDVLFVLLFFYCGQHLLFSSICAALAFLWYRSRGAGLWVRRAWVCPGCLRSSYQLLVYS